MLDFESVPRKTNCFRRPGFFWRDFSGRWPTGMWTLLFPPWSFSLALHRLFYPFLELSALSQCFFESESSYFIETALLYFSGFLALDWSESMTEDVLRFLSFFILLPFQLFSSSFTCFLDKAFHEERFYLFHQAQYFCRIPTLWKSIYFSTSRHVPQFIFLNCR